MVNIIIIMKNLVSVACLKVGYALFKILAFCLVVSENAAIYGWLVHVMSMLASLQISRVRFFRISIPCELQWFNFQ